MINDRIFLLAVGVWGVDLPIWYAGNVCHCVHLLRELCSVDGFCSRGSVAVYLPRWYLYQESLKSGGVLTQYAEHFFFRRTARATAWENLYSGGYEN